MGVNVTLLMVLSALFISVLDSMPRTAYVKMIDIWLLFCLTIPLLEIIFHAILDKYRYELELEEEELLGISKLSRSLTLAPGGQVEKKRLNIKRLQKLGVIGFPVMFIIFVGIYFSIGYSK